MELLRRVDQPARADARGREDRVARAPPRELVPLALARGAVRVAFVGVGLTAATRCVVVKERGRDSSRAAVS